METAVDKITEHHLRNLATGKAIRKGRDVMTVRTLSFSMPNGQYIVVPSIWGGDKPLPDREALKKAQDEGVFEVFNSREDAEAFDKRIHQNNKVLGGRMRPISAEAAQQILDKNSNRSVMQRYNEE